MKAYYNEIDPFAAAWLRRLIEAGQVAPGEVDERDIRDVTVADLRGYTQCHFFAGVGVWSYALRLAGWDDATPVWTGSCPCQPFSAAGQRKGAADERHLWPSWHHLIRICRPPVVFGEQVASPDALRWFDLVSADLEGEGYAVGAADLCAAGVGAPHIRQRLFFVADADEQHGYCRRSDSSDDSRQQPQSSFIPRSESVLFGVGDPFVQRLERQSGDGDKGSQSKRNASSATRPVAEAGILGGFWANSDWLPCRDGKSRPVESGSFPLAHGAPAFMGRVRGYGNSLVAPLAAEFVCACMRCQIDRWREGMTNHSGSDV